MLGPLPRPAPSSLSVLLYGRGTGNRTLINRLKAYYFTTKLYPHMVHSVGFEPTPHWLRVKCATVNATSGWSYVNCFTCQPRPYGIKVDTNVYLNVSCHSPLLISCLYAWRSCLCQTRFQSLRCFHHWGLRVRLPCCLCATMFSFKNRMYFYWLDYKSRV